MCTLVVGLMNRERLSALGNVGLQESAMLRKGGSSHEKSLSFSY
jgi:hypothetical protein